MVRGTHRAASIVRGPCLKRKMVQYRVPLWSENFIPQIDYLRAIASPFWTQARSLFRMSARESTWDSIIAEQLPDDEKTGPAVALRTQGTLSETTHTCSSVLKSPGMTDLFR